MINQLTLQTVKSFFDLDVIESNEYRQRALKYMTTLAEREGFEIDLRPNHTNQNLLMLVIELCDTASGQKSQRSDIEGGDADPDVVTNLKTACGELALASRCGVMQGIVHPEPEDIERFDRLFNTTHGRLDLSDTVYSAVIPKQIEIVFNVSSDDEQMLRLTPNVQLSLLDLDGIDPERSAVTKSVEVEQ